MIGVGGGIPEGGIHLQALEDDRLEVLGDLPTQLARRRRLLGEPHQDPRGGRVGLVGQVAREQLVQDHAEGEDVGGGRGLFPPHLLGRHVVGGADDRPRDGEPRDVGGARDAEVHQVGRPREVHHDVLGLHVAVHDALRVRLPEGAQDLAGESDGVARGQGTTASDEGLEAVPLDVFHREELDAFGFAQVVDAHHVLVGDAAREDELLLQAQDGVGVAFGAQGLEGDDLVELAIAGLVDAAHASFAQDAQDLVPAGEHAAQRALAGAASGGGRREAVHGEGELRGDLTSRGGRRGHHRRHSARGRGGARGGAGFRGPDVRRLRVENDLPAADALDPLGGVRLTAAGAIQWWASSFSSL